MAACDHPLGAAVTFYGGGLGTGRLGFPPLIEMAPDIKSPWLGFFGDLDQSRQAHARAPGISDNRPAALNIAIPE